MDPIQKDPTYPLVIRLVPVDDAATELVQAQFADQTVAHGYSFTGVDQLTVIVKYTGQAIGSMLTWFTQHQERFKDATIEVGKDKIKISGYPAKDASELLQSGVVNRLLRDLKCK